MARSICFSTMLPAASSSSSRSLISRSNVLRVRMCASVAALSLSEPARDVVLGPMVLRVREDQRRWADLDEPADSLLPCQHERGAIGHARGLLHVVRDDHNGDLFLK